MAQVYDLLNINDTASRQMEILARDPSDTSYTINVDFGHAQLRGELLTLIKKGTQFHNCIFTTHGNKGVIFFGREWINREVWYSEFYDRGFHRLFPFAGTKLYFAGCNVAEGPRGWSFLEAAARSLLRGAGGTAVGWTSLGFGLGPLKSGHVVHLWGDTRQVMVLAGGDSVRFFENWSLISDGTFPVRPGG